MVATPRKRTNESSPTAKHANRQSTSSRRQRSTRAKNLRTGRIDADSGTDRSQVSGAVDEPTADSAQSAEALAVVSGEDYQVGVKIAQKIETPAPELQSEAENCNSGANTQSNDSQTAETQAGSESQANGTPVESEPSHIALSPQSSVLDQLATDINRLHSECEQAIEIAQSAQQSALEHAKEAGLLLLSAKKLAGHGGWEKWREANLQLPSSTATLYQRVSDRWDELQEAGISSVKAAADYLKKPRALNKSATVAEMQFVVHEKDLGETLQAAQADFHQRKAAAESRAADNGSSIPKLQQGDTLTTAEDGQTGKVLAIANDGKVAVEWGNGHTGLYTPKEIEEYGYRRAESPPVNTLGELPNAVKTADSVTQHVWGLSEVHYAVRKFAALNERQWDEKTCDEVAAAVLDFLAEY